VGSIPAVPSPSATGGVTIDGLVVEFDGANTNVISAAASLNFLQEAAHTAGGNGGAITSTAGSSLTGTGANNSIIGGATNTGTGGQAIVQGGASVGGAGGAVIISGGIGAASNGKILTTGETNGNTANNDPLGFGVDGTAVFPTTGSPTLTLTNTQYCKFAIRPTQGASVSTTPTIVFPDVAIGYTKLLDLSLIPIPEGVTLTVQAGAGGGSKVATINNLAPRMYFVNYDGTTITANP